MLHDAVTRAEFRRRGFKWRLATFLMVLAAMTAQIASAHEYVAEPPIGRGDFVVGASSPLPRLSGGKPDAPQQAQFRRFLPMVMSVGPHQRQWRSYLPAVFSFAGNNLLEITPPQHLEFSNMQIGVNVLTSTLNVKASAAYQVDVYDLQSNPTTHWHLSQWRITSGSFVSPGLRLLDPLHVVSQQNDVTEGSTAVLIAGGPAGQQGSAGQDFPVSFNQILTYQDAALYPGESYHLILTWQAFLAL